MRLVGFQLLAKIKFLNKGRYDLYKFEGNIRSVLVECGYIQNNARYTEKVALREFGSFTRAYWSALKEADIFQNKNGKHKRYSDLEKRLLKKYKHKLTEVEKEEKKKRAKERELYRKKNPPIKQGKVKQIFDESIKENYEKEALTKRANTKSGLLLYDKLTGHKLLNEVIKLRHFGKTETSICVITGYEVSKIGVFRRQFAKAAGVKLAPLKIMIKEMKEKDFLVSVANKAKEVKPKQENLETTENIEEQEVFINREKISSQVKRLYRNPKFREKILKQHGSICSCCDIAMEKLIEAAHIIPVEDNGNDDVKNGIPLCPTHHTAFDNFLFTINPTDNSIIYKEGLSSEDLQITKTECRLKVSKESLEYRFKLFNQ